MRDRPLRPPQPHRPGARHLIAAVALLALPILGCTTPDPVSAPRPSPSPGIPPGAQDLSQTLRDIETTRLQALVDVDMKALEAVHGPDFQLIPPPGLIMSRHEYLTAVATGELDYLAFEPVTPIGVSRYGDAALVTYRSRIHIDIDGYGRLEHDTWHTYLYTHSTTGLGWKLEWEQATAVGGFPPP